MTKQQNDVSLKKIIEEWNTDQWELCECTESITPLMLDYNSYIGTKKTINILVQALEDARKIMGATAGVLEATGFPGEDLNKTWLIKYGFAE